MPELTEETCPSCGRDSKTGNSKDMHHPFDCPYSPDDTPARIETIGDHRLEVQKAKMPDDPYDPETDPNPVRFTNETDDTHTDAEPSQPMMADGSGEQEDDTQWPDPSGTDDGDVIAGFGFIAVFLGAVVLAVYGLLSIHSVYGLGGVGTALVMAGVLLVMLGYHADL